MPTRPQPLRTDFTLDVCSAASSATVSTKQSGRRNMAEDKNSFGKSVLGLLTGAAALLTAVTGLYVAVWGGPKQASSETAQVSSQKSPSDMFTILAVIDDPDGYTNVRSKKSASSEIVTRINREETFYTYQQSGNWWQIRTRSGKVGYIHITRIRLVGTK